MKTIHISPSRLEAAVKHTMEKVIDAGCVARSERSLLEHAQQSGSK
jgi:hypothetical protein